MSMELLCILSRIPRRDRCKLVVVDRQKFGHKLFYYGADAFFNPVSAAEVGASVQQPAGGKGEVAFVSGGGKVGTFCRQRSALAVCRFR